MPPRSRSPSLPRSSGPRKGNKPATKKAGRRSRHQMRPESRATRLQTDRRSPPRASRKGPGGFPVMRHQRLEVDVDRGAVDHAPFAGDHHSVRAMSAAQHECREWILRAAEARLVEREQREIGLEPDRDATDIVTPEATRRSLGRPAQYVAMRNPRGAVSQPADHQRMANGLHHVRRIVGGRPIHAQADWRAGGFEFLRRTNAGGEHHVGRRAVADADPRAAEPGDVLAIEVHGMSEPDALVQPAGFLEEIDRSYAVRLDAESLLVLDLAQMRMQTAVAALREPGQIDHQGLAHRERRAGREGDANERAGLGIME